MERDYGKEIDYLKEAGMDTVNLRVVRTRYPHNWTSCGLW